MKRIKYLLVIVLILLLTGCKIPEEEKPFDPAEVEIELKSEGNLFQLDENVTPVRFYIAHNQTKFTPSKITWTRNLIEVAEGDEFIYTPVAHLLSKTDVFATVTFTEEGVDHTFTTETKTILVEGITAEIEISTNHPGLQETTVYNVLSADSVPIVINAAISGSAGEEDLTWWVIDEETKQEYEMTDFAKNPTFTYSPTTSGEVRVEARLLGNKFISNKIYVKTNYGKLSLSSQVNASNQWIITSEFNNNLEGVYSWEALTQSGNSYEIIAEETQNSLTIDLTTLDEPKLIRAKFLPQNVTDVIVSEPVLVSWNHTVVETEAELLQALQDKAKVIELKNDIQYTKLDDPNSTKKNPLIINYPVTIIGKNHTLSSLGIFTFIDVRSNNVWFKDIKIDHSSRYNVLISSRDNCYFENVEFIRPGGGSDMLTPGAGIYAFGSDVTVKNIKVTQGYNSGFRVEAVYNNDVLVRPANITILGKFEYNTQQLVAPVVSVRSKSSDANITAVGFDEFIIPIGSGKMIRRWSNDAYGVKWQLQEPYEVQYHPGEPVNFSGITINVRIGANETTTFGMDFVYLFLDLFKETGTIRVTKPDEFNNPISEYIIYNYDRNIGGDYLLYRDDLGNPVLPALPTELGYYQVHIWVGDTKEGEGLYLGSVLIEVIPQDAQN